jgi:hypothetical protein
VTDTTTLVVASSERDEVPERQDPTGLGRLPWLTLGIATAVLVVAISYAMSRSQTPATVHWAGPLFWVGQVLLFLAPTMVLVSRRPTTSAEGLGIAFVVPLASYAILQSYHPIQFDFLDEFAHVQTAQSILTTHHLFHPNTVLPVSSQYPALEIVTTAFASISHLSIYASGAAVAGIAHVLFSVGLYLLVIELTGNPRVGGLAVVVYATGAHYQFFDSYFIYEVIALPFLVATLLAIAKLLKAPNGRAAAGWSIVAITAACLTIVSHHITSYVLALLLCGIAGVQILRGRRTYLWPLVLVVGTTVAMTLVWDLGVASTTSSYVYSQIHQTLSSLNLKALFSTGHGHGTGTSVSVPIGDTAVELVGLLALAGVTVFGIIELLRHRRSNQRAVLLACVLGFLSLIIEIAIRLVAQNGSELSARLSSFVLIPIALIIAITLAREEPSLRPQVGSESRTRRVLRSAALSGIVIAIAIGGIAGGWPAYYARFPGPFLAGAWERSVDAHNLQLGGFVASKLPSNLGLASDFITASVVAALGHEDDVEGVATLFVTGSLTPADIRLIRSRKISFIVVDARIAHAFPLDGSYFQDSGGSYSSPIPSADLDKFDHISGVSCIYSDGTLSVFDVRALEVTPAGGAPS